MGSHFSPRYALPTSPSSTRGMLQPSLSTAEFILIFHFAPSQEFLLFFFFTFFFSRALFLLSVCVTALFNIFMWSH